MQEAPDNIAQKQILFNVVLILLGQHCTGKYFVQCYPRGSRQHCTGKYPGQCCSRVSRQHCTGKKPLRCYLNSSCDNIAQVKILCNIVHKVPDNIAQEKILFNVVFILLWQHCTGKNPVQCCLNTLGTTLHRKKILFNFVLILSGQHRTRENPVECCLNTLGTTMHRWKSCSVLCWYFWGKIAQQTKTLCNVVQEAPDNIAQKQILFNVVLILLG